MTDQPMTIEFAKQYYTAVNSNLIASGKDQIDIEISSQDMIKHHKFITNQLIESMNKYNKNTSELTVNK